MNSISKFLNILDYALSLLLRQKLKNLSILLVFSTVIFLIASFQLVISALNDNSRRILTAVPDITVQQMSAGRQVEMKGDILGKLDGIYGITGVRKRIWGYYFDEKNGANYTVMGIPPSNRIDPTLQSALRWGRFPDQPGEVVIAAPVIESMQLNNRKSFSLFRPDLSMQSFTIVGVFAQRSAFLTDDLLLMAAEDAAHLFGLKDGMFTDLMISVDNPDERDTIAKKISAQIPGSRVVTRKQIQKTYDVVFSWRSGVGSVCLLTSIFAFVILAWDRASGLSPEERKEVAILKITGWQTADIMVLRFCESSVISLLSFMIGYTGAWIHVAFSKAFLFQPILLGWSVLKPSYAFIPPFLLSDFLLIFVCSFIPYLAATIVPAWRSGMVRPDTVI